MNWEDLAGSREAEGYRGQGGRHRGMGEMGGLGWNRDTTVVYP